MNKLGIGAALGLCAALCGCHAYSEYSASSLGDTKVMLTTADVRMTTERTGPTGAKVFCAEPSPDVAKAFSTAMQLSASAAGKLQAGVASSAAEQLAQLTDRVPSIQALRDGLYRACEAYSNGVLGPNAYAVILSRYGDILITLILAEDAAGNFGGKRATLTPAPPSLPQPPASGGRSQPSSGGQGGDDSAPTASASDYHGRMARAARLIEVSIKGDADARGAAGTDKDPGAAACPAKKAAAKAAACPATAHPKKKPGGREGAGDSATAAVIEAMQKNYFEITAIPAAPMFVMCANMIDPDRPHWKSAGNVVFDSLQTDAQLRRTCLGFMEDVRQANAKLLDEQVKAFVAANRRGGGR